MHFNQDGVLCLSVNSRTLIFVFLQVGDVNATATGRETRSVLSSLKATRN